MPFACRTAQRIERYLDVLSSRQRHAGLPVRDDGNNVSLDRQARLPAENALRFNVRSNLLRSQIHMVKSAIDEGKKG
jgi:flagellar basal body rod protein FlgB